MRILMTGEEGMVGTYLTKYLTDRGYDIIPFGGEFGKGSDITKAEDWNKLLDLTPFDGIIHLAALAGVRPSIDCLLYTSPSPRD